MRKEIYVMDPLPLKTVLPVLTRERYMKLFNTIHGEDVHGKGIDTRANHKETIFESGETQPKIEKHI